MNGWDLLYEYREVLLKLGADRTNKELSLKADQLEAELSRRLAW